MSGIIDCEMHIGDEVFVHGYIDEIRNDTIIIRNVGGYFGTSRDEVFYYEEDGTLNADRKTENSSEKPNNCKPTGYNLSPVDKDINVRSKDEQTDCNGCKFVGTYDTEFPCANCSRKTKDYYAKEEPTAQEYEKWLFKEPQTERSK